MAEDPRGEKLDLAIAQGKTFRRIIRWEAEPLLYAAITAIALTAPARFTAPAHGIPDGWRVAPVSIKGPSQLNSGNFPPTDADFHRVVVEDDNILEIPTLNASGLRAYTGGGYLAFNTPVDLAGCSGRMTVRDRVGGTVLIDSTDAIDIVIDDAAKTITLTIAAVDTEAMDWTRGVYDLEIEDADGVVTGLFYGSVTVTQEITT